MAATTLTVGALAREAGVSPQILRHYDRIGLLRPSARSTAGYRQYTASDRARLEVIRTLRALDLDLATIARVLRGTTGVRAMAELHLEALDHQARLVRRRAAVMRAALRHHGEIDLARVVRLNALAQLERAGKARFVGEQLGKPLANSGPRALQQAILDVATIELPEDATLEQLEAWLELAELVSDEAFLAHYRASASAAKTKRTREQRPPAVDPALLHAIRSGLAPEDPTACPLARQWLRGMAGWDGRRDELAFAREWCQAIDSGRHAPEQRFWSLIAVLKPELAKHPSYLVGPWVTRAIRAWVQQA